MRNTFPGPNVTHCSSSFQMVSKASIVRPLALKCEWRGCTYTGTFSHHAQLRRHVDTQHIKPRSFVCSVSRCAKTFNRRDNLAVHMQQMHEDDKKPLHFTTGEGEMHASDG
ncbi:hypothetical protein BJX66DRAFT_314914 [Aspergillus keveii]|uniref:C2H2-type domain-containing protein n=1 Tax=Aspergillus keveii TaxID=714993 RepID=A0ABR4FQ89_9EURO